MSDEKSDRFQLDVEVFEVARSVHRVIRAMHDGECPKCHALSDSAAMRGGHSTDFDLSCPECGFTILDREIKAAMNEFAPVMEKNLAVFEAWRSGR